MGIYLLTLLGLLFILVRENPFVMLPQTPADGRGSTRCCRTTGW